MAATRSSAPHIIATHCCAAAISAQNTAPRGVSIRATTCRGASAATWAADSVLASITVV